MSRPCPKTRALSAYLAGRLSSEADLRVRTHLEQCDTCRESFAAMQLFEESAEFIRSQEIPELRWERMEKTLGQVAQSEVRKVQFRRIALPATVVLAAAAVALLVVGVPSTEEPSAAVTNSVTPTTPPPIESPAPNQTAVLTAISGCIGSPQHESPCLQLGAQLEQGDRLSVDDSTAAHIRLRDGTGVALAPATEIMWDALREDVIRIKLEQGQLTSEVASLREGQVYEVHAGPWVVAVRGTRFTVSWSESRLEVAVDEGSVDVSREGQREARIGAPGRWASTGQSSEPMASEFPAPMGLVAASDTWPTITLPESEEIQTWRVGANLFQARNRLHMRAPTGQLQIFATLMDGSETSTLVEVIEGDNLIELGRFAPEPPSSALPQRGTLPPDAVRATVRQGLPGLRRCYETALRRHPEQAGRFTMRLQVTRDGRVRNSQVRSVTGPPPASLQQCLTTRVAQWTFPAPRGGPVVVDVPLRFAPSNR